MELADEGCTFEEGEQVDKLIASSGEHGAQVGNVGCERCRLRKNHQQSLGFLEGFILNLLNSGDVVFDNSGNHLLQAFEIAFL